MSDDISSGSVSLNNGGNVTINNTNRYWYQGTWNTSFSKNYVIVGSTESSMSGKSTDDSTYYIGPSDFIVNISGIHLGYSVSGATMTPFISGNIYIHAMGSSSGNAAKTANDAIVNNGASWEGTHPIYQTTLTVSASIGLCGMAADI